MPPPRLRPDPGLYGPDSEAWRLNREAMLLLGAGPRALLLQIAHPAVAAGRQRPLGLPRRPVAPAGGHPAQLPDDRLRLDAAPRAPRSGGSTRSIAGSPGPATRRATRSSRCGSTRRWSTRRWPSQTRGSNRCRGTAGRAYYAETCRSGGRSGCPTRCCRRTSTAFDRYVAAMLAPDGPVRVSPIARELAGVDPPAATGAARSAVAAPDGRCPIRPRARAAGDLCLDAVAVGRPAAAIGPRRLRPAVGCRGSALVSAWLVAGFRAWRPLLPRPSGRCRRHSPRIGGWARARASSQPPRSRRPRSRPSRPSAPGPLVAPVQVRVGDDLVGWRRAPFRLVARSCGRR